MTEYRPYAEYADGRIFPGARHPDSWEEVPLRRVIQTTESGTSVNAADWPADDGELGVLKTSAVYGNRFRPEENKTVVAEDRHRVSCPLREGSLIVSRMNTPDLVGAAGLVNDAPENIFLPDRLWQISFNDQVKPRFVHYWSLSDGYRNAIKLACAGTSSSMQNLSQDQYRSIPIAFGSLLEQKCIVETLDRETARIDALIEKKTRFIELLKEKRQALITQAVTKGLDPTVPMKDSGVEWIGEVPAHWDVHKLHWQFSVELGKMLDQKRITGRHSVPYLRNQDVQWGQINSEGLPSMDIKPEEYERYTVKAGDLLVCEGGDVGRAAIWTSGPIGYQKALHRLRPRAEANPKFMYYLLIAAKSKGAFDSDDAKATISHLPADKFRQVRFPFADEQAQESICTYLDSALLSLDRLTSRVQSSIGLLTERRSALITAAVTGQIDLREDAA